MAPGNSNGTSLEILERAHQLPGKAPGRKQGDHQQHAQIDDEGFDIVIFNLGQRDPHPDFAGLRRLDPDDVVILDLDPHLGRATQLATDVLLQIGVRLGLVEAMLHRLALGIDIGTGRHIDQRLGIFAQRQLFRVDRKDQLDLIGQQVTDLLDGWR